MHKYRSWFMGLGIGLILGATMLQVILMAKEQSVMVAEQTITREQLNEEAEKSGLVLLTSEQLNSKVEEAVAIALEEESSGKPQEESPKINDSMGALKPPTQPNPNSENSASPSESAESSQTESARTEEHKEVTLYIPYKMTLTEVAKNLKILGVIEDENDFIAKTRSISKKISVGTAILKTNSTYQQIMEELVREKTD